MAQQSTSSVGSTTNDPLTPGSFRSLLPILDDILAIIQNQATDQSGERTTAVQASEAVAPKAKELAGALDAMKAASLDLPGGHLSIEEVRRLTVRMEEEADKRRRILHAFSARDMPNTDHLGAQSTFGVGHIVDGEMVTEANSAMPSPSPAIAP